MNAMYLYLIDFLFFDACAYLIRNLIMSVLCIIYMHMLHIPLFFLLLLSVLYSIICDMILVFYVKIYFYMHVCINLSIIYMYVCMSLHEAYQKLL